MDSKNFDLNNKKSVICYLLRHFYNLGWCTGSGGGISIREDETSLWIAPSGVHKEFVVEDDLFLMNLEGKVLNTPNNDKLRCSECTPLFLQAYNLRNAGAVLHSHSLNAVMITKLFGTEFQVIDIEMIKGIFGHKNTEWCRIPIIDNTEFEPELTNSLRNAIITYPNSYAVMVRNHGIYVWGETWQKAKIYVECYEYLFKAVLEMHKLGLNVPKTPSADPMIRAWMIDTARTDDIRNDLQHKQPKWVSPKKLDDLGLLRWKLDGSAINEELEQICKDRDYKNRDEKMVGRHIPNYEEMCKTFATEHLHADEEIRYVLNGSGYFDVRDENDELIRIHVVKGDLLVLPEGIYHRYVPDIGNDIHVMRLFKDEPKWTPINRPCDDHPSRAKYINEFLKKFQK
jgi:methylthioribulose-1-phosphate dehydratase